MRITCPHCNGRAIVYSHPKPEGRIELLYCECKNPECHARFVYRAYFSHDLQPPLSTLTNSLCEQLAQMDPRERRKLFETFQEDLPLFAQ